MVLPQPVVSVRFAALAVVSLLPLLGLVMPAAAHDGAMVFVPVRLDMSVILAGVGDVTEDTPQAFAQALEQYGDLDITILCLSSPGGDLAAGLALGDAIRAVGLDTAACPFESVAGDALVAPGTWSSCASACALAALGGVTRWFGDQQLGVHQHYSVLEEGQSYTEADAISDKAAVADLLDYTERMGIASRLVGHAMSVPPDEMGWLSTAELTEYDITAPGPAAALQRRWALAVRRAARVAVLDPDAVPSPGGSPEVGDDPEADQAGDDPAGDDAEADQAGDDPAGDDAVAGGGPPGARPSVGRPIGSTTDGAPLATPRPEPETVTLALNPRERDLEGDPAVVWGGPEHRAVVWLTCPQAPGALILVAALPLGRLPGDGAADALESALEAARITGDGSRGAATLSRTLVSHEVVDGDDGAKIIVGGYVLHDLTPGRFARFRRVTLAVPAPVAGRGLELSLPVAEIGARPQLRLAACS